jgi:Leucine-rich repeat (LRR) protein
LLDELICGFNQLTSLDVANCIPLRYFLCSSNQLTDLNISDNTAFVFLWCGNNRLTSLDLSNNPEIYHLDLVEMPTLEQVCAWTMPFPPENFDVDTTGSPNVYFTTECSR